MLSPSNWIFFPLESIKMWTFLGIASFTYLYKKFDTVLTLAPMELMMAAALFLTAGLLLSYIRYFHNQRLRLSQMVYLPLSLLSLLPVINHFIPQTSTNNKGKEENFKKVRRFIWIHALCEQRKTQTDKRMKTIPIEWNWIVLIYFLLSFWELNLFSSYSRILFSFRPI